MVRVLANLGLMTSMSAVDVVGLASDRRCCPVVCVVHSVAVCCTYEQASSISIFIPVLSKQPTCITKALRVLGLTDVFQDSLRMPFTSTINERDMPTMALFYSSTRLIKHRWYSAEFTGVVPR